MNNAPYVQTFFITFNGKISWIDFTYIYAIKSEFVETVEPYRKQYTT